MSNFSQFLPITPVANGGTGLTSAGTSGNVLTSNGTDWVSSAPTSTAGKVSRTSTGSITAGNGVQINSDGTVSIPSVILTTLVGALGTPTANQFSNLSEAQNQIVYLPLIDRYFTAWINTSRHIYGSIGTPATDGSISWSSQIAVDASGSTYYGGLKIEYYPPTGKILLVGAFNTQANWGFVISPTASTFTVGTGASLGRWDFPNVSYTYDSVNQKFVAVGVDGSTSNAKSAVVSISGTTASVGTVTNFAHGISNACVSYDTPSGKILLTGYSNPTSMAWVGTVSGTTISYTASINLGLGANIVLLRNTVYISAASKNLICYYNNSTNAGPFVRLLTVSGSSVSVGSETSIASLDVSASYAPAFTYDSSTDRIVCIYTRNADTYLCTFTMPFSGTTINSPSTVTVMRSGASYYSDIAIDTTRLRVGSITSNFSDVYTFTSTYGSASMTANNFLGFAESTVTTGQSLNVTTISGVNTSQSGLTTGSKYYVSGASGNLSTSGTIPAGIALSATSILTKG